MNHYICIHITFSLFLYEFEEDESYEYGKKQEIRLECPKERRVNYIISANSEDFLPIIANIWTKVLLLISVSISCDFRVWSAKLQITGTRVGHGMDTLFLPTSKICVRR